MDPQNDQRPGEFMSLEASVGWLLFISRVLAAPIEVFLHRWSTFGDRYLGWQAVVAIPLLLFFPVLVEGQGAEAFLWYLGAYLTACFCIRVRLVRRQWLGGPFPHSFYTGAPRIHRWLPRLSERYVKAGVEPALVVAIAGLMLLVSPPLALYLMVAALGQSVAVKAAIHAEHIRVLDLNDAYIEQGLTMTQFRDHRGDRD